MKKKIFVLILAILCLTAVPALAAGCLELGGVDIISQPSGSIGGGTYAYDADTKTLTLNNVNLTAGVKALYEFNENMLDAIVLKGENTLCYDVYDRSYAVWVDGDIVFTGDGSLKVIGERYSIAVWNGDLIIDGVDVEVEGNADSPAIYMQNAGSDDIIEIRNGGSLTVRCNSYWGAIGNSEGGIQVRDSSCLVIDNRKNADELYDGSLTVSDTSRVEIRSKFGGLPAQTVETAEAAVLTADDPQNHKYGLSFNKGSEPYIFTVTQTAMDDGRNLVTITGAQNSNAGGEAEVIPMPETGDESHLILWAAMLLTAMVYFIKRRKANA